MHISVSMSLIGVFALEFAGETIHIRSPRIQAFLAYLALNCGKPQSRQHLAFLLWPDSNEAQAFTNLRTLLHRTNKVLSGTNKLILIDANTVMWHPDTELAIDVHAFLREVERGTTLKGRDDSTAIEALENAVNLYRGKFLADFYDEWIEAKRRDLHNILQYTLNQLVILLEKSRQYAKAIPYALRAVELDPLNEVNYLTLMRLHNMDNDRASAVRVYHRYVSILRSELEESPSSLLTDFYERLVVPDNQHSGVSERSSISPLIGRVPEWTRMQAISQVVIAGRTRFLTIAGEAGIGKTRLAEEFLRWAQRQGFSTAVTHCYYAEGDLAYAPVRTLIQTDTIRRGLNQLDQEWLIEIARVAPAVVRTQLSTETLPPVTAGWQRQHLFEALARLVLVPKSPIALLVDDIQWCDQETLEWIHFLLRFDPTSRVMVVATLRQEEVDQDHPIVKLLVATRREGRLAELVLNPLSHDQTTTLAEHIVGQSLKPTEADHLHMETEGNPFFIVEMLRSKLDSWIPDSDIPVTAQPATTVVGMQYADLPQTVLAVIQRRISLVSENARMLLNVASVIGRSFNFDVLEYATKLSEDALVQCLDELWQKQIVREQASNANGYDFSHGKLRSVVYAQLSAARKRILHRRVAQALEIVYASDIESISSQIAMHYQESGDNRNAIIFFQKAGNHARSLFANEAAITYYQRAITLLNKGNTSKQIELHDQLADMLHFTGQYETAREHWQTVADRLPQEDYLSYAHVYRKIGNAWREQHKYNEALAAYDLAEHSLTKITGVNEANQLCWGEIKFERLNVFYWLAEIDEMLTELHNIQKVFDQRGTSKQQQARLHQISGITLLRKNRYTVSPEVVEHARNHLALLEEMDDDNALPAAHFQVGFVTLWGADNLQQAEQHMRIALELAEKRGDISLEARCLTYLTVIMRLRKDLHNTRYFAERSLDIARSCHMQDYIGAAYGNLAWVAWQGGDKHLAHSHTDAALEAWQKYNAVYMFEWIGRLLLIEILTSEENLVEALAQIPLILADRQKQLPPTIEANFLAAIKLQNDANDAKIRDYLNAAVEAATHFGYL